MFSRRGQSHECAPATSLEEYFSTCPDWERPIFEAVMACLERLGPMHLEPVSVGIFIKSAGGFLELRTLTKWVALWFPLDRRIEHPRIARKPVGSGRRLHHAVNLSDPAEVDEQVCE